MLFLFIGPSGVGKGTYAKLLVDRKGFIHASTGDLIREYIKKGTERSKKMEEIINKGQFLPPEYVIPLIKDFYYSMDKNKNYILDGFPRSIEQAKEADFLNFDKVVSFEANDSLLFERLMNRRICPIGKEIYNLKTMPPKEDELCDVHKVKLIQRKDDYPEAIKKRLEEYHSKAEPLLDYYKKKVIHINAEKNIEDVYKELLQKLGI